ncbi:MAG: NYN domain-containing protein [bacterium]
MYTYVFIDASNLFYGGKKSLGWSIDHEKLTLYFKTRYQASKIYYFGGVEIHDFPFDYNEHKTVPIKDVANYLVNFIDMDSVNMTKEKLLLISSHLKRIRFYIKIEGFGYNLVLKPVKTYKGDNGTDQRKANCDVDMTFCLMRYMNYFDRVLILSGDGDFLPVLKYLRDNNKEVLILARSKRTAREIKKFAGDKFLDFEFLRTHIEFNDDDKNENTTK